MKKIITIFTLIFLLQSISFGLAPKNIINKNVSFKNYEKKLFHYDSEVLVAEILLIKDENEKLIWKSKKKILDREFGEKMP